MDYSSITSAISAVGFPIVACCVMWYQNSKMQETLNNVNVSMQNLANEINDIKQKNEK